MDAELPVKAFSKLCDPGGGSTSGTCIHERDYLFLPCFYSEGQWLGQSNNPNYAELPSRYLTYLSLCCIKHDKAVVTDQIEQLPRESINSDTILQSPHRFRPAVSHPCLGSRHHCLIHLGVCCFRRSGYDFDA